MSRFLLLTGLLTLFTACTGDPADPDDPTDEVDDDEEEEDEPIAYGPDNGWDHALEDEVPAGLSGTGYRKGDVAHNWTFLDQNGDEVELYQFYGKVVVLDVFAEWCGPCQQHAPTGEEIWSEFQDDDVVVIAMMQEVTSGASPTSGDDAARWANEFGLSHPVVADADGTGGPFITVGYPTYPVLGPDMTVIHEDLWPPSKQFLQQVLEDEGIW